MEDMVYSAERRQQTGSQSARRLRRQGKVPAVLYGHGEEVLALALSHESVEHIVTSGHHLVNLDIDGKRERAIIREVQWDSWGREILHIDFGRVALDERVTVEVEIVPHGTPKAVLAGAVLEQPLHSVEVSCQADRIPDEIRVEVGAMEVGQMIHVRDLDFPEGVVPRGDPDQIVFILQEPRGEEVEAAPEEAAPAPSEPEVIGRPARAAGETEEAK